MSSIIYIVFKVYSKEPLDWNLMVLPLILYVFIVKNYIYVYIMRYWQITSKTYINIKLMFQYIHDIILHRAKIQNHLVEIQEVAGDVCFVLSKLPTKPNTHEQNMSLSS